VSTVSAARLPAVAASLRVIGEPFFGEELLLFGAENKLAPAVFTLQ